MTFTLFNVCNIYVALFSHPIYVYTYILFVWQNIVSWIIFNQRVFSANIHVLCAVLKKLVSYVIDSLISPDHRCQESNRLMCLGFSHIPDGQTCPPSPRQPAHSATATSFVIQSLQPQQTDRERERSNKKYLGQPFIEEESRGDVQVELHLCFRGYYTCIKAHRSNDVVCQ